MAIWYPDRPYRTPITSQNAKVLEAVTNGYIDLSEFPSAGFQAHAKDGGGDIRITKADGITEVAREIVTCDTVAETGEIHFDTTGILTGSDVIWWLYYGDPDAVDYDIDVAFGAEAVWEANYKGVWHFQNSFLDSTANDEDAIDHNTIDGAGKIGRGRDTDGGDTKYVSTNYNVAIADWSHSLWVNCPTLPGASDLIAFIYGVDAVVTKVRNAAGNDNIGIRYHDGAWKNLDSDIPAQVDTDYLINTVYTGSTLYLYVNGVLKGSVAAGGMTNTVADFNMGHSSTSADMVMDEGRIAATGRSQNWITTVFNNQDDPSTFWSVGAEETIFAPQVISV